MAASGSPGPRPLVPSARVKGTSRKRLGSRVPEEWPPCPPHRVPGTGQAPQPLPAAFGLNGVRGRVVAPCGCASGSRGCGSRLGAHMRVKDTCTWRCPGVWVRAGLSVGTGAGGSSGEENSPLGVETGEILGEGMGFGGRAILQPLGVGPCHPRDDFPGEERKARERLP